MIYRRHADDIEQDDPVDPSATLLGLSASGARGHNAVHGRDGAHGSGSGGNGQYGGDAGPAQNGAPAGMLLLNFKRGGPEDTALIAGEQRDPRGNATAQMRDEIDIGEAGYIDLVARGGRGGDGGNGGDGGHGARGSSGSDATRYSSGSDGGPGGDGGYGGNATGGGHGGAGGSIVVGVRDEHTDLLMLLRQDVRGGSGGRPGANGRGGSGGAGGSGGSSYSWTESESYTDAQGNSQTRTTHHSNPGGSDGSPGRNGGPGRAVVTVGRPGRDGTFEIECAGKRYPSRYEVRLVDFKHKSDNADGIYEPGERIRVDQITVANVGGMPTPSQSDIELRIEQLGWVIPDDAHLTLFKSLPPGKQARMKEPLWFTLGDYQPKSPDDPLACPEEVRHDALLPSVRRSFVQYEQNSREHGKFLISFPVQSPEIEGLTALAPDEAARLRFSIKNVSKVAFGRDADNGRRVTFRLAAHDSGLGDAHAMLLDGDDQRASLKEGWRHEIAHIASGETKSFEATLAIKKDAPHYESVTMWLALGLGYIDRPNDDRPVQYRALETRVSQRYVATDGADVMLVVNHRTTREVLEAWREAFAELGLVAGHVGSVPHGRSGSERLRGGHRCDHEQRRVDARR